MASRIVLASTGAAVLLVVAVPVGRLEGRRAADEQLDRIEAVRHAVGPRLDSNRLQGYRFNDGLACLLWSAGGPYWQLELCWDRAGRLVESVDRRGRTQVIGSVTYDPALARERVPESAIVRILQRHGVPSALIAAGGF